MDLSCAGGDNRRLFRSLSSLSGGALFISLRASTPGRAILMAATASPADVYTTGRGRSPRCRTGAILTVNSFHAVLNSPRGSGQTSLVGQLFSKPIFSLGSSLYYITALLRPFGNDLIGTGDGFRGWQNYLEAPMSYCGLLSLVIFPQIFVASTLRDRILYGLFLSAVLLTTIFPWFRYSFWAFQGDYYRTLSLFAVFGIITLGMTAFSRI